MMVLKVIFGLIVLIVIYFFAMGYYSTTMPGKSADAGLRFECGDRPNCVSSEAPSMPSQEVEPLSAADGAAMQKQIMAAVAATGGTVMSENDGVIVAEYKSRVFGFVDDVMFKIDPENGSTHVMSASRVGYSDLNANRERVEKIREQLSQ
ncbi:MAG: DUF1499 domain-containing protein [Pseudomonadota bacterium]